MISIAELSGTNSNPLCLEFSENDREQAWLQSQNYSNDAARWTAYLNHLCLNALSRWLQEETNLSAPSVWGLPGTWEMVNGTALSLGKARIACIPSEAIDVEEFCVPQEWVDIPSWVADYYLAVQLVPDECYLRVWGFTTHSQLKNQGDYDPLDRTYTLEQDDLIQDINAFLVALELCTQQKVTVKPLPALSREEAENLLQQLSQPSPYSPRLEVEFERWAALMDKEIWRQQLYERRNQPPVIAPVKPTVNLSTWFESVFEAGWQTVEDLFGTKEARLAFVLRSDRNLRKADTNNLVTINALIDQLKTSPSEHKRKQAALRLGEMGMSKAESLAEYKEAIAGLIHLIRTTKDEETRWIAAESLWKLDPGNPATGVKRGIDLGMQLAGHPLALLVGILEKSDGKVAVLLQVHPMKQQMYLPPNLQLLVLDEAGNTFREAQARSTDIAIQLKFSGSRGERFTVKVALGEANITEEFVI